MVFLWFSYGFPMDQVYTRLIRTQIRSGPTMALPHQGDELPQETWPPGEISNADMVVYAGWNQGVFVFKHLLSINTRYIIWYIILDIISYINDIDDISIFVISIPMIS